MPNGLLDYLDSPPSSYFVPGVSDTTPNGGTGLVNYFPGTNWPADTAQRAGFTTPQQYDAFQAMLWRESGGRSGKPMPPPPEEDPRLVASRARDAYNRSFPQPSAGGRPMGSIRVGVNPRGLIGLGGPTRGGTGNPGTGPSFNPTGTPLIKPGLSTTIRNPGQQTRLGANLSQFSGPVGAAKAGSLTQFTQDFLDQRAKAKAALGQEQAFVGQTFDPNGLEARLGAIARNRAALGRQAAESAIRRAGRAGSISRMVNGGNASYLDQANTDIIGRILLENAMKNNDLRRENETYVQGQRQGSLGARRNLGMQYAQDALIPYNSLTDAQAGDLGNIGRIANLEDNNTLYDYVTPDQAAGRNLGMLNDLEQRYNRYLL